MHVLDHLMEEHRKVEQMLARLKGTDAGDERTALLGELRSSLATHMAVEERFIYPLMAEVLDQETADDATDEHDLTRDGLAAAEERVEEGAFEAAIETLEAGIAHHVQEEEGELFPKLRRQADDRLARMDPDELESQAEEAGRSDDATKAELYQQAKQAGIPGRSQMTKDELADALAHR
jgi:iron-sulfur cluster repair protein YtfE (RIC family)